MLAATLSDRYEGKCRRPPTGCGGRAKWAGTESLKPRLTVRFALLTGRKADIPAVAFVPIQEDPLVQYNRSTLQ
jgi:hypothetical protein